MGFAGVTPKKIDKRFKDVFKETFNYCSSADTTYYETFEHYMHEEEGFEFGYKYVVKTSDYSQGDHGQEELDDVCEVELFLVVSPENLNIKVYRDIAETTGVDAIGYEDIVDYGLGVEMGSEEMSASTGDIKGMLNTIANIVETVNITRGFYLDRPWNMVGNTGWDIINKCVFNEDY